MLVKLKLAICVLSQNIQNFDDVVIKQLIVLLLFDTFAFYQSGFL